MVGVFGASVQAAGVAAHLQRERKLHLGIIARLSAVRRFPRRTRTMSNLRTLPRLPSAPPDPSQTLWLQTTLCWAVL